jgi:hypothetical protein
MIPKEFDVITKGDIDALVANAVGERRTLEYKQQLPGNGDEDKREFLADIASFANAGGGDLLYGITDKRDDKGKPTGIPEKADGLVDINADAEMRRLDESIRSGIDPRIPGIRLRAIDGFSAGPVLLLRIPRSWAGPHMVTFKNLSRFFSRTSAGRSQLDVREIRSAFTANSDLRARITNFRTERLGKIIANEGPVLLPNTPKVVLHVIPLTILDSAAQLDLMPLEHDPNLGAPLQGQSYSPRFNIDGYISSGPYGPATGYIQYTQVFRSGAFEAVDANMLNQANGLKLVPSVLVESSLLAGTRRYLKTAQKLGVPLPMLVMVAMHGLKGYGMATNNPWQNSRPSHAIDRDTLLLPDVLLDDFTVPADKLLRPVFDAFWQSAGFTGCQHYNSQGQWDGGQSQLPGGMR